MTSGTLVQEGFLGYNKNMYFVYLLKCSDNSDYVGYSEDIKRRVLDHNYGKVPATVDLRPVKLHWFCVFNNKKAALDFEAFLKSGSGTAFRHKRLD
jgi:putative endonuclease